MGREWKPGDVAMVSTMNKDYIAIRTSYIGGEYTEEGAWQSGPHGRILAPELTARPLVVIDPEDDGDLERLLNVVGRLGVTKAALRSLVEPPKPSEPTGLGAVVEDAKGKRWIRVAPPAERDSEFYAWSPSGLTGPALLWSDVSAVRVLSEGVNL